MFLRFLIKAGSVFLLPLSDQKCNRDWKGRFFFFFFLWVSKGKLRRSYLTSLRYLHIILPPPSYFFPIYSSHFYALCMKRNFYPISFIPPNISIPNFFSFEIQKIEIEHFLINFVNLKISFRSNFFVI